jgi:hypothetical protein
MTDHVDALLKLWRSTVFDWGDTDCMLSVGDYIASRGGQDVTGLFRGTYADEAGALAHVAAYGGVCGLVDLTGLPRIASPARGDVVCLFTGEIEVGAVCTGIGIAARLERGVVEVDMRLVKIVQSWKVP